MIVWEWIPISIRHGIRDRWRMDRVPILLFFITFVVMSYPFVFHMHDSLPIHNTDTFKALWQNWWLLEALKGKHIDVFFSDIIFYPDGVDVSLDPRRWVTFPIWATLKSVFDDPLAFNLVALFGILFKAYGMYLFGLRQFQARIPAWVAGAFYAFAAPALVLALRQPNTGATEWIPWFMLFFAWALSCQTGAGASAGLMVLAGICFAMNMYMNQKIAIFAMFLGASYLVWNAIFWRLWARRRFWMTLVVFALTAFLACAPLLLHTLRSETYAHAIDRTVDARYAGSIDFASFFYAERGKPLNYRQSVASLSGEQLEIGCLCAGVASVGLVAVVFAFRGGGYILRFQRKEAIMIVLAIVSFLLSLGIVVYVNSQPLGIYWTPYRLLENNYFFRALHYPPRMVLVMLFPLSILIGYGVKSRLRKVKLDWRETALLVVSTTALFYGTSIFPLFMLPDPRPDYLAALEKLPEGGVIDLPMGRHESKYYMSLQRFHGRPMVEGMLPRTPPDAYDYIRANPILDNLYKMSKKRDVDTIAETEWRGAVTELLRDGFRYVIVHYKVPLAVASEKTLSRELATLLMFSKPVYKDRYGSVYDLAMWIDTPTPFVK